MKKNKKKNAGKKDYSVIWFIGLAIVFVTLFLAKTLKLLSIDWPYFVAVSVGIIIFYLGAFLSVQKPYARGAKYLQESANYIYLVIVLFFLFGIFAFFFSSSFTFLDEVLRRILEQTKDLSTPALIDFIFFNNLQVSFSGLFLGFFLGIFPLINVISNGAVLGYVFAKLAEISRLGEFWRIFPHGIFELPAVFISLALGIKLGMFIFAEDKLSELKRRARESLIVFVFYVAPLLIIAAVIEGVLIGLSG